MEYNEFLKTKQKKVIVSGFDVPDNEINSMLFDFQKFTVKRALKAGKYAIFADTGQGKTPMQLEIARQVNNRVNMPVLILSPLAVSRQTIEEGQGINEDSRIGGAQYKQLLEAIRKAII